MKNGNIKFKNIVIWWIILIFGIEIGVFCWIKIIINKQKNSWYKDKINITQTKQRRINLWDQIIELKDYQSTKQKLTEKWKNIINQARDLHKIPTILSQDKWDDWLCAWYLIELTELLRWKWSALAIWMYDPIKNKASSARELPYSYRYYWWKILTEISDKIAEDPLNYINLINNNDLKNIFLAAFSEEALLGDIWFLYKDTSVIKQLWKYGNYNSHITKNLGISKFSWIVNNVSSGSKNTIKETLWCDTQLRDKLDLVLPYYQFTINDTPTILSWNELREISWNTIIWTKPLKLKILDKISINDITLWHFYQWALVNSLLKMTCKWNFYPINVLSINPKFIEKI